MALDIHTTIFYKYSINAAYLLCLSPFRICIEYSETGNAFYVAKFWLPQKLFCLVQTLLGLTWIIREFVDDVPADTKDPVKHFLFMSDIVDTSFKLLTIKQLWFNQHDFLKLSNFLLNDNSLPRGNTKLTHSLFAGTVVFLYAGLGITNWILGSGAFGPAQGDLSYWSITGWWTQMVDSGWNNFFLHQHTKNETDVELKISAYSNWDIVVGLAGAMGYFNRLRK